MKPGEKPGEKPGDKPADKPPEKPPTLRPAKPAKPADPNELKVRPENGMISISFKGQPWPAVLEWLAEISGMSLDWQEAPADYLDLTTHRSYKVDEIRDLINSALLARGYSLLRNGEMLIVVNLKKLDVSLVPRITAAELDNRDTYELVKVFFDLNRLRAEAVVEEFKPLLSPYGKVSALKTTNRLDALDTAGNLRRVRDLLAEEQSASGQNFQIREFRLRHTRAGEVVQTLNSLLGIKPKGPAAPMSPEQMQQQQQQQQAMMEAQQRGQQGGGQPPAGPKSESEVLLAVNARENSILANATADKLAVIEQAIKFIDVPQERPQSALANLPRVQVYRLAGVDPDPVVKVLQDLGNLDPTTRLEVDQRNKAIIASAPLADHVTIRALVEKIDGSGRRFEVIQLKRLDAEYVAGSIEFLVRGNQENKTQRSRYSYYDYFGGGGGRGDSEQKDGDKFQVEADTENNRLLLRVNTIELEEIRQLLVKLGEISEHERSDDTLRVIPAAPGDETERLLERIRRLWPSVGPNPLQIDPAEPLKGQPAGSPTEPAAKSPAKTPQDGQPTTFEPAGQSGATQKKVTRAPRDRTGPQKSPAAKPVAAALVATVEGGYGPLEPAAAGASLPKQTALAPAGNPNAGTELNAAATAPEERRNPEPSGQSPVSITRTARGLVITSQDPLALERMMELAANVRTAASDRRVFSLRHSYAKDVATLLQSVFSDDESKNKQGDAFSRYYFYDEQPEKKDTSRGRLSKRRPLKFVPDPVTNTILVQGADAAQLAEVERLIDLYDRVEPPDSQSVRRTQMIPVHYSTAAVIAEVVKDVYRDLLSPNDKALQTNQQQQQRDREPRSPFSYYLFGGGDTESEKQNTPRFKGMLSVGVDTKANMVVVSAPQFLLTDVAALIKQLDETARPQRPVMRVMKVGNGIETRVRDALSNIAEPGSKRATPPPQQQGTANKPHGDKQGKQPNQPVNSPPATTTPTVTEQQ